MSAHSKQTSTNYCVSVRKLPIPQLNLTLFEAVIKSVHCVLYEYQF